MAEHEDYWEYSDADARAAINNIFGADGKADADIDLDGHVLKGGNIVVPNGGTIEALGGPKLTFDSTLNRLTLSNHQFLFHAGTVSAPCIALNTDPDTGFYFGGPAGRIDCAVAGVKKFTVSDHFYSFSNWYAPNGIVWGPSYAFNNSPGSGMYRYGANVIGFSTAGVCRLTLDSVGSLDIIAHDLSTKGLKLAGTLVVVSAAELNHLDGVAYCPDDSAGAGFRYLKVPN